MSATDETWRWYILHLSWWNSLCLAAQTSFCYNLHDHWVSITLKTWTPGIADFNLKVMFPQKILMFVSHVSVKSKVSWPPFDSSI
jgi:hypothetical protein